MRLAEQMVWSLGPWCETGPGGTATACDSRGGWTKPVRSWECHWTTPRGDMAVAAVMDESLGGEYSWRIITADPRHGGTLGFIRKATSLNRARADATLGLIAAVSQADAATTAIVFLIRHAYGRCLPELPLGPESTCWVCTYHACPCRWDDYNTNGDCLESK